MTEASSNRRAWLELLRPPNLFTVPGDSLAGFFLTSATGLAAAPMFRHAAVAALVALLLYMGGLVGNDAADYEEDRRHRPGRPLPSGRVSRAAARAAAILLALVALALAAAAGWRHFFLAAVCVQLAIMLYNGGLKRFAIAGAIAMGACRGGSFLMGAVAAGWRPSAYFDPVVLAAVGLTLYIAGVTWIADCETVVARIGPRRWLPAFAALFLFAGGFRQVNRAHWPFLFIAASAIAWSTWQGLRLRNIPSGPVLGSSIGGLIRGLLLLQAAFCALGGRPGLAVAAGLLALWPLSVWAGRRFYAT
jgi:4-hydroxybenzoate polyprenyltransferase